MAYPAPSGAMAWLTTIKEAGIYAKYGFDVDLTRIAGSVNIVASILAGETPFAQFASRSAIEGQLSGGDVVIVATAVPTHLSSIWVHPSIQTPKDLVGKKLGITRPGDSPDFVARAALKFWGLEPITDVALVPTAGSPEALAAMQAGAVDGTPLSPPTTAKARQLGFRKLLDFKDTGVPYANSVIVTTTKMVQERPDAVERFVKAIVEGTHFFKTNKEVSLRVIASSLDLTDSAVIEDTWQVWADGLSRVPLSTPEAFQPVLDQIGEERPEARAARPESFYDNRFVQQLVDNGFINGLYKGL